MKKLYFAVFRFVMLLGLVVNIVAIPARQALAANLDTTADRLFGQPDFISNTANNGGVSASSLNDPAGLTIDTVGNMYVADLYNHRVLEYDALLIRVFAPLITR